MKRDCCPGAIRPPWLGSCRSTSNALRRCLSLAGRREAAANTLPRGEAAQVAEGFQFLWMAVQNLDQAYCGFAGRCRPAFILLECAPSATDNPACLFLGEAELLANSLDARRVSRSQFEMGLILSLQLRP